MEGKTEEKGRWRKGEWTNGEIYCSSGKVNCKTSEKMNAELEPLVFKIRENKCQRSRKIRLAVRQVSGWQQLGSEVTCVWPESWKVTEGQDLGSNPLLL